MNVDGLKTDLGYDMKRGVVYFEVVLLVLSSFAFAYVIGEMTPGSVVSGDGENNLFDFGDEVFGFIGGVFDTLTEPVIPFVSAASVNGCCGETTSGEVCGVVSETECASGESFAPGVVCESVAFCEVGCCYDDLTGIYDQNVVKDRCERADWVSDPFCNLPGADLGCCVLGDSTMFRTEGQCRVATEIFSLTPGYDVDWRAGLNELECVLLAGKQSVGACVLPDSGCTFGTQADCLSYAGEYAEGILCTSPELNTTCEMSEDTTCVSGKDQVFFTDSCGNIANIYDSSKATDISYWTTYVAPEDACDAPNGAVDSKSCGNCDRFEGGVCALAKLDNFNVALGDYYCKESSCEYKDQWGSMRTYENGESWCVYDGPIGEGDDVPGSRDFRYVCNNGEVVVEPCADYRNEICVQQDTLRGDGTKIVASGESEVEYHNAVCRKNNAKNCIAIGEVSMGACRDEPDCMVRSVEVGGTFSFDICVPMFPEGFSFEPEFQASGAEVCSINTRTCVVSFEPLPFCVCVDNCGCLSPRFDIQMDEVCTSLGDCGSSPNYFSVGALRGEYIRYDPRVEKYMIAAGLSYNDYLGVGSSLFEQSAFSGSFFAKKLDPKRYIPGVSTGGAAGGMGAILAALGAALAAIGGILGSTMMSIIGAGLGAIGGIVSAGKPTSCPPIIVPYTCNLWEPPVGDADCDFCNDNSDIPCTEYRCGSLGAACEFINKGTPDARCSNGIDDGSFPVVIPASSINEIIRSENLFDFPDLLAFIENVSYERVSDNYLRISNLNGGCVAANTPVPISFTTHEEAQCKFDLEQVDYEDMKYFVGAETYIKDHVTFFRMPDPSHGESQGLDISAETSIYILCSDRYGHKTPEYLKIDMCVLEGDDETVPFIGFTEPAGESFISYDDDFVSVGFITNELSTCRWDYDSATPYENMQFSFECNDDFLNPSTPFGYFCNGSLPVDTSVDVNTYYVKCSDQPWLVGTDDVLSRNAMTQAYEYILRRPDSKIVIDSLSHSGELVTTSDKKTVPFEVRTSGGAEEHTCSYSFSGYETMIPFYDTGFRGSHSQAFDLGSGKYDIFVECVDETGDVARGETSIRILEKSTSPLIARVWQTADNLYFITQEEAVCVYSSESCIYSFDDGASLSGDGITHRISAVKGLNYFVKCQDGLGNVPSGCSIVLSAV